MIEELRKKGRKETEDKWSDERKTKRGREWTNNEEKGENRKKLTNGNCKCVNACGLRICGMGKGGIKQR